MTDYDMSGKPTKDPQVLSSLLTDVAGGLICPDCDPLCSSSPKSEP